MASVTFDSTTRIYPGATEPSVDAIELNIKDGEFLVLVGPSGCGKSTTLRMLAGLEDVSSGRIFIGDRDVTHLAPKDRDIAMVFQNYALYPHMTVRENMGFALKMAGRPQSEITERVEDAARTLDLTKFLDRKPQALSGGQRQRVAMGRAIVRKPQVFLMDEPLSNLDAKLRVQTRSQIAALQADLGVTTLFVTHDQTEALTMGDRIAVLKDGVLQQVGTPHEVYTQPANAFVAGFIGSPAMNMSTCDVHGDTALLGTTRILLPPATRAALVEASENTVLVGFRPENLQLTDNPTISSLSITLEFVEELGSDSYVYGPLAGESLGDTGTDAPDSRQIIARIPPLSAPKLGSQIHLRIDDATLHFFSTRTGERLPS
ncbi:Trehalose import ATP-binding protein SugC [Corynebacterium ciconiae DSM 44920]|uniref:ABC transporter ATP-binding protein n=1 Tax=Corynebacterium ciconiae TaxID=227319 RepID=UPI00036A38A5|nr:sn-glycerol-3-phosphate ABC transporter ATP-binding protein UgpC [Corynebacterium ciconiae]WKD61030.1 Trehalose import ATP-binding protein SugC [Corynebacterium ciconiae DSM 44920]